MLRSTAWCDSALKKHGLNSGLARGIHKARCCFKQQNCPGEVVLGPCQVWLSPGYERKVGCGCSHQRNLFFPATPSTPRSSNNNSDDNNNINNNILLPILINCPERPAQCRGTSGTWLSTLWVKSEIFRRAGE